MTEESGVTASLRWPGIVNRVDPILWIAHEGFLFDVDEAFTRSRGTGCTRTGQGNVVEQPPLDIQCPVEGAGWLVSRNRDAPRGIVPGEVGLQGANRIACEWCGCQPVGHVDINTITTRVAHAMKLQPGPLFPIAVVKGQEFCDCWLEQGSGIMSGIGA